MPDVLSRFFGRDRRRLEKRLQLALRSGRMAAWEWDLAARRRWWSPEMFMLHGLRPEDGLPPRYLALLHPDDRESLRNAIDEAVRTCQDHAVQYRVLWPDGSVHWIEGNGSTLCDDGGRPELMTGVCVNIDARKAEEADLQFLAQASAELAALKEYPETMQRVASLAVPHFADWCAVDMIEGNRLRRVAVAHVDEAKVRLAHELHERFPPDPKAPGGAWNVVRTRQPELVPVITPEMLASTIEDPECLEAIRSLGLHSYMGVPLVSRGTVLGVMSFITSDSRRVFTERELAHASDLAARAAVAIESAQLLDALRRADAAKDVFLATLAHELRNPLAPIVNSLELLTRAEDPQRLLPQALNVMRRQTTHLARLVDDLLDLARINSGKIELQREPLDLREALRAAVETCQPLIDRRRHAFSVDLPGEAARVRGDAVRLTQVFTNLLNNAAKYTPEQGRIEVRMELRAGEVEVSIADSGVGMDPELVPKMFELFTQAPRAAALEQPGLGIGLFLVRRLVEMHEGRIAAESAGAGRGSRFTVTLPAVQEAVASAPPANGPEPARSAKRVLVVDDNADAAETLSQLLALMDHEPRTAHDGTGALQRLEEFRPDVVLLDIGLPDMDGYEVARRIRSRAEGQAVRLVALTGWGQKEDKARAAAAGFDDHWTKPVDPARLAEI